MLFFVQGALLIILLAVGATTRRGLRNVICLVDRVIRAAMLQFGCRGDFDAKGPKALGYCRYRCWTAERRASNFVYRSG